MALALAALHWGRDMRVFVENSAQFKPIILRVTIESAEEQRLLRELFGADKTMPRLLWRKAGSTGRQIGWS